MQVKLIDHMGSDLTVVNAARVSFAKVSEWDEIPFGDGPTKGLLNEGDEKLIKNYSSVLTFDRNLYKIITMSTIKECL